MKEIKIETTGIQATIKTIKDARELQDWCEKTPGLVCHISAMVNGGYFMSVEGENSHTREFNLGDTVTWDGAQFSVTHPED